MSKSLPSFFRKKPRPRVDFNPSYFRSMVQNNGVYVLWEMVSECPCTRSSSGLGLSLDAALTDLDSLSQAADLDCPSCKGRGYRYHSPQTVKCVVTTGVNNPRVAEPQGDYVAGTISVTSLPEHRLNYGDRITLQDSVIRFRETQRYEDEAESTLKYPVHSRSLLTNPTQEVGVLDVYAADETGTSPLNNELVEGTDFTVSAEGGIVWINPPATGVRWAISYYARPVYVVTDIPYAFRDTITKIKSPSAKFTSLPMNARCTLEYMASGSGAST